MVVKFPVRKPKELMISIAILFGTITYGCISTNYTLLNGPIYAVIFIGLSLVLSVIIDSWIWSTQSDSVGYIQPEMKYLIGIETGNLDELHSPNEELLSSKLVKMEFIKDMGEEYILTKEGELEVLNIKQRIQSQNFICLVLH